MGALKLVVHSRTCRLVMTGSRLPYDDEVLQPYDHEHIAWVLCLACRLMVSNVLDDKDNAPVNCSIFWNC